MSVEVFTAKRCSFAPKELMTVSFVMMSWWEKKKKLQRAVFRKLIRSRIARLSVCVTRQWMSLVHSSHTD